jgi:hypothetical protein
MNQGVWLARLLAIGGILEIVAGLGLLVAPSLAAMILLGASLDMPGVVIGRLAGGGLLALGIACWRARKTPLAPAGLGVSWGFLVYNIVACVVLAWAGVVLGHGALPAWGLSFVHGVLAVAVLVALLQTRTRFDRVP